MNSIFISSSFKDMQHERDTIRYKTLPQINDYLRNNYGQETTVIDLRWGINTNEVDEQASMRKIVRTCLFEIDHCKPFMIVLLGDRYGTIIDKKQFNNCGEDFDLEDIDDIGVTELEVRYAMHLSKQNKMHVFFYFRNMDYSAVSESDRTNIYFDSDNVTEKRDRLNSLKREIRATYPEQIRTYDSSVNSEEGIVTGMDALSNMIFEDIKSCVSAELGEPKKNPLCIDDAFIESKCKFFIGRNNEMAEIENFLNSAYYNIAILRGGSGTGKSAIMANVPKRLKTDDRAFLAVFCGQSNSSDSSLGIMRNIVYRLRQLLEITLNHFEPEVDWDIKKWHQEMDLLIDTYVKKENKQLIILIDAVDQMIQDIHTKKMYFLPSLHNDKIKVLFSVTTDYKVEESLPLLEKMILINVQAPTAEETQKAIDEIWGNYGKPSVATEIKNKLLKKPLSDNYLYINLLLNRLSYMNSDVFGNEKINEQYIVDNIKEIIDKFPDTLEGATEELLKVLGNHINKELGNLLFSFLRLSNHGLRITDIQCLCGDLYDAADFSYFKMLLGNFIFEREDHRYDFTHKIFRSKSDTKETAILNKYFVYSSSLSQDDSLCIPFFIHSAVCAKKYSFLYDMITKWSATDREALKAAEYLAQFIETSESVIDGLIDNYPLDRNCSVYLMFITDYLMSFLSSSEKSKKFIDGISNVIFADSFDMHSIDKAKLEAICIFEKKHFEFDKEYFGNKIDTHRYYWCLEELASRTQLSEYIIRLENFKLNYEPYWDVFNERYNLSKRKEDIDWRMREISKEIIEKLKNSNDIDSMLLRAKAYVKYADCEYAEVIAFRNEHAEKLIHHALKILKKVSKKPEFLFCSDKVDYRMKIAECYYLIGHIYMRVTDEDGLSIEAFRRAIYNYAIGFFEDARKLYVKAGYDNLDNDAIKTLIDLLCWECIQISYIEDKAVKEINKTVSTLAEYLENNMYQVVQSQSICSQYAEVCTFKADIEGHKIPELAHISQSDLYPWSTVYTKEENYKLFEILKNRDYWCDKSVALNKYLFYINPTPNNAEQLAIRAKARIANLNYYEYRSLETINNSGVKHLGYLTEIDVAENDIRKDRQYQEKRKIPFLLLICEALKHPNVYNKNIASGIYLIAAKKLLRLQQDFATDICWMSHTEEMQSFKRGVTECVEYAMSNKKSFAFYLLTTGLLSVDTYSVCFDNELCEKIKQEYKCNLEELISALNNSRYNALYDEWSYALR